MGLPVRADDVPRSVIPIRDPRGRFLPGGPGGPGNPHARRVAELRSALFAAVSADDLRAVVAAMLSQAKRGDVAAAKLILSYTVGKPQEIDAAALESSVLAERLDRLTVDELRTLVALQAKMSSSGNFDNEDNL